MKMKTLLCMSAFAAVFGLSWLANAQSTKGLWIAGGARAFGVYRTTAPLPGLGEQNSTSTSVGLLGGNVGIGYQFGEHFLLGGRFGGHVSTPENSDSIFLGSIGLHMQIPFLTGKVRPFILIEPSLVGTGYSYPFNSQNEFGFRGELGGGAHLFVTDSFSISPYGSLGYQTIPDRDVTTISFEVGALLSGWVWR